MRKLHLALLGLASAAVSLPIAAAQLSTSVDFDQSAFHGLRYRNVGPSRGGRVTTVTGVPQRPATFYMGATGGGVWKTTDYGQSWSNISDGYFATGSIGSIRVAPSNPDIVYVGTGSDGIRSNVITGRGAYRSDDGGDTWKFIGLRDTGQIGAVEIHPRNPDIVFLAALGYAFGPSPDRGVYRTSDGGTNWERMHFVSERTGAVDLEIHPTDPDTVYASMWEAERKPWTIKSGGTEGGVWRSTDGGDTWTKLGGGLPTGIVGKSDLAVSAADPDRLYVLMEAAEGAGLYRSDDRGETFRLISTQNGLLDRPFYYTNIDADPSNADVIFSNSTRFLRSTDAGATWERLSTPHGDNHDIWISPNDPDVWIQSNDGGANVTRDGGKTWSTQHNQPTAELYQVAVDDRFPYWLYAGQQDNSTIRVPSRPPHGAAGGSTSFWQAVGGCETGPAIPRPGNADIVYSNCKGRFGRYNHATGQEKQYYVGAANMYGHNPKDLAYRFQRVSPIHVSPHDPNVVYHASQYLHRTTDEGVTWERISPDLTAFTPETQVVSGSPITRDITGEEFYSTIYAVEESKLRKGLIWVGANDGPVHVTRDGGASWDNVTPTDLPPGGRVQNIEPSPHRPEKAYFAAYRYLLGDWQPYIYRTNDSGRSWTRLTDGANGIPSDTPTRVVREDPDREGLLYAGTEFGMYISFDDGATWKPFHLNLPITPVTDIRVHRKDLVLSTMGRSFWILDNVTPLHQLSPEALEAPLHLFSPRPAYRTRGAGGRGRGVAGSPDYGRSGVALDYIVGAGADSLKLEILNPDGDVVRTIESDQGRRRSEAPQQGMRGPRFAGAAPSRLETSPGVHRFYWDMRRSGAAGGGGRSRGGPLVAPATFTARLTGGGRVVERSFELRMDPRVAADGVTREDLVAQERIGIAISELAASARDLLRSVDQALERVGESQSEMRSELDKLRSELTQATGPYPQPMLVQQISYLGGMVGRADQKVGRDAYQRLEELTSRLRDLEGRFEQIEGQLSGG